MRRVRAMLQLLRVPNLCTAVADVWAGFLFVGAGPEQYGTLATLAGASVCFYAGGVVLNDVFDASRDAVERPDRPIPSGAIPRGAAAILGSLLLASGIALCAWNPGPARGLGLALAACILCYDGLLKNTALAPATMGICRAINLLLGMSVAGVSVTFANVYAAALMWLYVASLTLFARGEANVTSRGRLIIGSSGMVLAVVGLIGIQVLIERADTLYLLLVGVLLGQVVVHARQAIATCAALQVQRAVQVLVLSIILFDGCLAFVARGPLAAAAVVVLLVPSIMLGRIYKVT